MNRKTFWSVIEVTAFVLTSSIYLMFISAFTGLLYFTFYSGISPYLFSDTGESVALAMTVVYLGIALYGNLRAGVSALASIIFIPIGALVVNESIKGIPQSNIMLVVFMMFVAIFNTSLILAIRQIRRDKRDEQIFANMQMAYFAMKGKKLSLDRARNMKPQEVLKLAGEFRSFSEANQPVASAEGA